MTRQPISIPMAFMSSVSGDKISATPPPYCVELMLTTWRSCSSEALARIRSTASSPTRGLYSSIECSPRVGVSILSCMARENETDYDQTAIRPLRSVEPAGGRSQLQQCRKLHRWPPHAPRLLRGRVHIAKRERPGGKSLSLLQCGEGRKPHTSTAKLNWGSGAHSIWRPAQSFQLLCECVTVH